HTLAREPDTSMLVLQLFFRIHLLHHHRRHLFHLLELRFSQDSAHLLHQFQHLGMMGSFQSGNLFILGECLVEVKILHFHGFHMFHFGKLQIRIEADQHLFHLPVEGGELLDLIVGKPQLFGMFETLAHHFAHPVHRTRFHHRAMGSHPLVHHHLHVPGSGRERENGCEQQREEYSFHDQPPHCLDWYQITAKSGIVKNLLLRKPYTRHILKKQQASPITIRNR